MTNLVSVVVLIVIVLSPILAPQAYPEGGYAWEPDETGQSKVKQLMKEFDEIRSRNSTVRLRQKVMRLNGKSQPPPPRDCGEDECFKLYYITGEHFNIKDNNRKNILYIPGGPGQIATAENRMRFLEVNNNVVYFHLRGAGLSQIPRSDRFDQFLRAEYVVEDIEQLRSEILRVEGEQAKKWDAIYGFSYGTVIAQKYAHRYPDNVRRLVLSAPVVRNKNTDKERTQKLRSNLENIYRLIRSKGGTPCDCANRVLKVEVQGRGPGLENIQATDNFCFLTPIPANIIEKIQKEYDGLVDEYGAIGIVTANYEDLKNDNGFKDRFPYPKEFFVALRQLQLLGAPEKEGSPLTSDSLRNMVDAAMILGYYAAFSREEILRLRDNDFPDCRSNAPFLDGAPLRTCERNATYCKRVDQPIDKFREQEATEFLRALYVFGLADGMDHWLPRMLREDGISVRDESCPTGEELLRFVQGSGDRHKFLRKEAKKIGILSSDPYCLWNPAKFRHQVQTLLVAGGADVVTAGCQAEDFFNDGLAKGNRVLIEFPRMGHMFDIRFIVLPGAGATTAGKAYTTLIDNFLRMSVSKFRQDAEVKKILKTLGAQDRTPEKGLPVKCRQ